ncbi:chymotrypsin-like elastase family member 2A [Leptotrombidium deliense]|uniref:Chymotrypsin-like elastase family member 2A n=1 Tax=Leptotrombidium deliense TaxID=299467 RepID=A0A443SCY8_9ACAR|nr:chymotrypsin-like elastase family member 2A [Leptotrombidium deliense]
MLCFIEACGAENMKVSTRIIGGTEVQPPHRYPWLAVLIDSDGVFCGATVISSEYLITCAHCVNHKNDNDFEAVLGAHDLTENNLMKYKISETIVHTVTNGAAFCRPPTHEGPVEPNIKNCGIANENGIRRVKRIVDGYETKQLEYPWTVAVAYNKVLIGSGVLISNKYILTAMSTIEKIFKKSDYQQKLFKLIIGAHDITKSDVNKISCSVVKIVSHPSYDNPPYDYNFALISFECPPNKFDESLHRPICLPRKGNSYKDGANAIIAGWGKTKQGGSGSTTLRKATISVVDEAVCKLYYGDTLTKRMMCFTTTSGDACDGDAGGPVMYFRNGRYYLMAIIWYYKCGNSFNPAINGDVSKVLQWITRLTQIQTA